jgi:predicted aspartyl protease
MKESGGIFIKRYLPGLITALLLFSFSMAYDDEDNGNAMPAGTDAIIIPLKNAGRLFMIEAVIDNESGNLIFDTGATGLVLNRTYFRKYVLTGNENPKGITGSVANVENINTGKISFAGLSFNKMSASLADLGHIENRRGVKVLGLMGFDMIKDFEIVIDVTHNQLQLFRIDNKGIRKNSSQAEFRGDHTQKIEFTKNILFLNAEAGGKILKFCLDTGAETNAISDHSPKSVLSTISIERRSNLRGAGSSTSEVYFGIMKDLKIGEHTLKNMETIITSLESLSEAYGVAIDGMLGYNFLSKGVICINFVKRQMDIQFIKKEGQ